MRWLGAMLRENPRTAACNPPRKDEEWILVRMLPSRLRMRSPGLAGLAFATLAAMPLPAAPVNPDATLDRPYTLRPAEPAPLEREHARLLDSGAALSFTFPRPCISELDSSRICHDVTRGLVLADSTQDRRVRFSPLADLEYRRLGENVGAFAMGLEADGHSGPVSFYLDARMYTEGHEDPEHTSYDRDFVERQNERQSGSVAYSSYSRFRSSLSYDFSWGRLTAARDAAHWGPGMFHSFVFNQAAVPFNQLAFTTHLGPLTVRSLYGQLATGTDWESDTTGYRRSIYAHRYEWRATQNLLLGVSEQIVLHKAEAPFAFLPVVPLYIAKAGEKENLNNGNLAGDLYWRLPGAFALYGEFLLDDIQSPATLFNDDWGNKWAMLAGAHAARDMGGRSAGLVLEYARVEPWVYTHKVPRGSQTAHFDQPLGNPLGPNSQAMTAKAYLRRESAWYASARMDMTWKGTDRGSSLLDLADSTVVRKRFLEGVGEPEVRIEPYLWVRLGPVSAFASTAFGSRFEAVAGVSIRY